MKNIIGAFVMVLSLAMLGLFGFAVFTSTTSIDVMVYGGIWIFSAVFGIFGTSLIKD